MTSVLYFGDCRFDPQREELWREDTLVPLRPKPLALLRLMLAAPGRPLGKAELLERLWPGVVVGEGALTVCVNELRSALGDRARTPRYIETLHTRGYRFLGVPRSAPSVIAPTSGFVGRERELERLRALANEALAGRKRMVAIEGEAGIGKTTLIAELLRELRERADVAVGRCVEAYGAGEPYMPLLDALAALCRGVQGARVRAALHRYAPTWLVQMPAHVPESEQPMLAARAAGNSQPRMLRELADVIEVLTRERPLVLVLEDLHDSDTSTLTLLRYLMQEREAALLVLASFRSASSLPLRSLVAELLSHRQCELLELSPLTRDEVAGYLATRLEVFDESLLDTLHARSGGNPLFMVTLVDHVLQQDGALAQGMPARLRPLIELQLARLSAEERELLLTASVAGQQFTVAGVAACLHSDRTELIERELVRLTRESPLLRIADEQRWPDGTLTQGFAFRHVLQHEVIYGLLAPARRRVLHDRLAQCLLRAFAGEPATIAAELAVHFERGERHALAAGAVADAAASALLRSAQSAALAYTARGFALLERANDVALRRQLELRLRLAEGAALLVLNGFGSSEAERAYRQAHELCAHNDDPALLAPALCGLWHHALTRARYDEAERIAAELTALARAHPDPILRMQASNTSVQTRLFRGEPAAVLETREQDITFYDPRLHGHLTSVYGADPGVLCRLYMALGRFLLGLPRSALAQLELAQSYADALKLPFAELQVLWTRCVYAHIAGDVPALRRHAPRLASMAGELGFFHPHAFGRGFVAWLQVHDGDAAGGLRALESVVLECQRTGLAVMMPHTLSMLAHAQAGAGQPERALRTLLDAQALSTSTGECWYLAELQRLQGDLLRTMGAPSHAIEACYRAAIATARAQGARPFARRARLALRVVR